jgi:hypothetical protein
MTPSSKIRSSQPSMRGDGGTAEQKDGLIAIHYTLRF